MNINLDQSRELPSWQRRLSAPVDAASLGIFRIGFGLIATWWAVDYLRQGLVSGFYVQPAMHFRYYLFDYVQPWPGAGPYIHFVVLALVGVLIAVGLVYRIAMPLFAVAFATAFLWDRANYQNHYYLLLLLSGVMSFLPLHRAYSLDALEQRTGGTATVPAWMLWLIRFHIGLPYFFGGIAKLNADWLSGVVMRDFLQASAFAECLSHPLAPQLIAWSGLSFDLSIVPMLLWRRTRLLAYFAAVLFHVTNHFLFHIHIFPWFMLLATTVFFEPDWPRRWLRQTAPTTCVVPSAAWSFRQRLTVGIIGCYVVLQLILPMRHVLYGGDIGWHERGHYFAWRMMLRSKRSAVRFYVTDPVLGETWHPNYLTVLSPQQLTKLGRDPEMVLDFAHFLAEEYRHDTGRDVEVRALVLTSYNGRKPQLLIDPTVDLAHEPRGFYERGWIRPQNESLPEVSWTRPVEEWEAAVSIPPLPQPTRGPRGERLRPPQPSRTIAAHAAVSP